MKRRLLLGLKLTVSVALLGWVLHEALTRDGVEALGDRLSSLSPTWLLLAAAVQMLAIGLGVWRWRVLLRAQGIELSPVWLVRCYLIGRFVGAFTPSTAGLDVYRAIAVARKTGRKADATSVVLVEKGVGLLGLSLLAGPATLWAGSSFGWEALAAVAVCTAGASAGLILLRYPAALGRLARILPGRLGSKAESLVVALSARGLSLRVSASTVFLSFAAHAATAAVFIATASALGLPLTPGQAWLAGAAIVVATLLPISIGGIGVREGVAVVVLGSAGISPLSATLVAVLGYLVGQVPAVLGGGWSLVGTDTPSSQPTAGRSRGGDRHRPQAPRAASTSA